MKLQKYAIAFVVGLAFSAVGFAQAPAGAPSGATGQCRDGSYTTNATKKGACRGHKGVQTWFAAASAKSTSSAKASNSENSAAPAPAPAASAPSHASSSTSRARGTTGTPAPGGSPGLVWVNTSSNVYHCYGSKYYGTTKGGKYETEAQAKAGGAHADHGKACSK